MIEISNMLKKYGIKPNKFMGQNFLIDEDVLNKIIESANLKPDDIILEVGPGLGILTIELAKRVKKVIAIEKDAILCQTLTKILEDEKISNVELINEDILKVSPPEADQSLTGNYKIVANIPYYLTSPLIRKFLEINPPAGGKPNEIILMVQKEVAERIIAQPPHINLLAISVQFYAKPEIISMVSKNSFSPVPKVDSAIIKIIPHVGHTMSYINTKEFFELVKIGFSSKRKMLINNLKNYKIKNLKFEEIFKKTGINLKARAENLSINDWLELFHNIGLS